MKNISFLLLLIVQLFICTQNAQPQIIQPLSTLQAYNIECGADRITTYLPLIIGKKVAVFANQTSMIGHTHLVDTLLSKGVQIKKIFGPEHGFRGNADAGEHVNNGFDIKTGIPIISLYGDHKKPTEADLKDIDVLVFDIQDVGVRFYTFISSLEYCIEACIENKKPMLVLDRPNPNGFYVDGPVLDKKFKSFVGMQAIPIVYGMTVGEYAMMLLGENWLSEKANTINKYNTSTKPTVDTAFHFLVIKCKGYTHKSLYTLPIAPSPNLKEMQSIYLYPSTCFFEGTSLSEGRGTDKPFQIFGHPSLPTNLFAFTPMPNAGAKSSKCFNQRCFGWNESGSIPTVLKKLNAKIQLSYLLKAYILFPNKDSFFLKNNFIDKLAGTNIFQQQVKSKLTETEIKKTWQKDLLLFKKIRKKYLLYPDFE